MNQGVKVLLGGLALVGIGFFVFASGEKKANAASGPPQPLPPPVIPPLRAKRQSTHWVSGDGPARGPRRAATRALPPPQVAPGIPGGVPTPGTQIQLPGGGSIAVPAIPGLNAPLPSSTPPAAAPPLQMPLPSPPARPTSRARRPKRFRPWW